MSRAALRSRLELWHFAGFVLEFLFAVAVVALIAVSGFLFLTNSAAASQFAESATISEAALAPADAEFSALNWSGYVAPGGGYTEVSATWTVPYVEPSTDDADATWVGIGGSVTQDLIQAGTEALPSESGEMIYQAWYEVLPASSTHVPLKIHPGDVVSVLVKEVSEDTWLISIKNQTTGTSYENVIHYESSRSSAEWIQEMPTAVGEPVGLSDFGVVRFSNAYVVKDGERVPLSESSAYPLDMVNESGEAVATPSIVVGEGDFTVTREAAEATPMVIDAPREPQKERTFFMSL